jgi:hypothetical protein
VTWGQGSNIPKRIKDQVRRRDRVCQLHYPGCTRHIDEFDHPNGLAGQQRQPVRSAHEIQGVCSPCHRVKTEGQRLAGLARAKQQRGSVRRRYRDLEPHPGRPHVEEDG